MRKKYIEMQNSCSYKKRREMAVVLPIFLRTRSARQLSKVRTKQASCCCWVYSVRICASATYLYHAYMSLPCTGRTGTRLERREGRGKFKVSSTFLFCATGQSQNRGSNDILHYFAREPCLPPPSSTWCSQSGRDGPR